MHGTEVDGQTPEVEGIGPHDCRLIAEGLDALLATEHHPGDPEDNPKLRRAYERREQRWGRARTLRDSFRALAERGR